MRSVFINLLSWVLDYLYVGFWQIRGFLRRDDASKYLHPQNRRALPIVIIPGIYEKWHFMKPIVDLLYSHGYEIHVIDSIGYNTGDIEVIAEKVEAYIDSQNIDKYIIVAHSKGGLIAKYLMMRPSNKIVKTIAINTPFSGSWYATLIPHSSLRVFIPSSPMLSQLRQDVLSNQRIVSIYGLFDPHIPRGSHLEGATNITLNVRGHFRPTGNKLVHKAVIESLNTIHK